MADVVSFGFTATKNAQRLHAAQAVKEVAAKTPQRQEVAAVGIGGTHADHRHKQWDQRGGAQQDQPCNPVIRENREYDQQRHKDGQRHLRQIAGIVIMHIVDLLKDKRRPTAGGFALNPGGASFLQPVEHLAANFVANILPGVKSHALA